MTTFFSPSKLTNRQTSLKYVYVCIMCIYVSCLFPPPWKHTNRQGIMEVWITCVTWNVYVIWRIQCECVVAVCCCSVLLQCVVPACCCSVLLQCVVARITEVTAIHVCMYKCIHIYTYDFSFLSWKLSNQQTLLRSRQYMLQCVHTHHSLFVQCVHTYTWYTFCPILWKPTNQQTSSRPRRYMYVHHTYIYNGQYMYVYHMYIYDAFLCFSVETHEPFIEFFLILYIYDAIFPFFPWIFMNRQTSSRSRPHSKSKFLIFRNLRSMTCCRSGCL